jgi:hypothetical protein
MSTITRVRFVSSLWNVTTPECDVPFVVFHAIRSFLRRSVIWPSHSRVLNQIFSRQLTWSRPFFSTSRTRCMNFGNDSKSAHFS